MLRSWKTSFNDIDEPVKAHEVEKKVSPSIPEPPNQTTIVPAARLLGAASIGALLEPIFQPIDTMVKRLQTNGNIFNGAQGASFTAKLSSLFNGLSVSIAYGIVQRIYKFGCQPIAADKLKGMFPSQDKASLDAVAGAMIGVGELMFLPIDNIKVKRQTGVVKGDIAQIVKMARSEGRALYNGWEAVLLRNIPGSFTLFGVSALIYHRLFALEGAHDATFLQNLAASSIGAMCCVIVTNPADVIKVRTQKLSGQGTVTALSVFLETLKNEGVRSFGKGLKLRLIVACPKLTAVKMGADALAKRFNSLLCQDESSSAEISVLPRAIRSPES